MPGVACPVHGGVQGRSPPWWQLGSRPAAPAAPSPSSEQPCLSPACPSRAIPVNGSGSRFIGSQTEALVWSRWGSGGRKPSDRGQCGASPGLRVQPRPLHHCTDVLWVLTLHGRNQCSWEECQLLVPLHVPGRSHPALTSTVSDRCDCCLPREVRLLSWVTQEVMDPRSVPAVF